MQHSRLLSRLNQRRPPQVNEAAEAAALTSPDSISWQVFKNPVAIFVGGITAVLLELAEPNGRLGPHQLSHRPPPFSAAHHDPRLDRHPPPKRSRASGTRQGTRPGRAGAQAPPMAGPTRRTLPRSLEIRAPRTVHGPVAGLNSGPARACRICPNPSAYAITASNLVVVGTKAE